MERFFKGYGKILEVDLKNGYGEIDPLFVSGSGFCTQAAPPCEAVVGALSGAAVAACSLVASLASCSVCFLLVKAIAFVRLQRWRGWTRKRSDFEVQEVKCASV